MSSLGRRLILLRENQGLNQSEAAKLIGISKANLSRYESNNRNPGKVTLKKLTDFYKVSASYLVFGDFEDKQKQFPFLKDITVEEAKLLEKCLIKIRKEMNN